MGTCRSSGRRGRRRTWHWGGKGYVQRRLDWGRANSACGLTRKLSNRGKSIGIGYQCNIRASISEQREMRR